MIKKNITANVLSRVWGLTSVYLFVPLYLKFLHMDAYGLVGFYSTLLGVLAFADMGFTATLNREMARLSVCEDSKSEMRDLLRTFELTYFLISLALAVGSFAVAPFVAEHWLHSENLKSKEMSDALSLMGIAIAFQLPSGLFIGGLMGLQKQIQANMIQIVWSIFRGLGSVLVLWLISPTIYAFALWQLISNIFYCFWARFSLWRVLSIDIYNLKPQFKLQVFRITWRYATGMAGAAVLSALLTQTDKLVVSKLLTLETLGCYTLAATLATVPSMLASPIASAVFPRLTGLVTIGDRLGLAQLYHLTCDFVAAAIIPAGLTIAFFAGECIFAWTGSTVIAKQAGPAASLLIGGQVIQAILITPYYLALAHGNIRLNLMLGTVSVLVITPLLIYLVTKFGIVGAGCSWFVMNICTLPPYMFYLHRHFLPGELRRWYGSICRPLVAALPFVLLGYWFAPHSTSRLFTLFWIGVVWLISSLATAAAITEVRVWLLNNANKLIGVTYGAK